MEALPPERKNMILPESATSAVFFAGDQILFVARTPKGETQKFISNESLRKAVGAMPVDSGWLPESVKREGVTDGQPWFISFHERKIRRVYIGEKAIRIPCPGLVFVGKGRKYFLFAAREKTFSDKMKVYTASYPNLHPDQEICFGRNRVLEAYPANEPKMWRLFWDAPFTGDIKNTYSLVHLAKEGLGEYPTERLKEKRGTINDLVDALKGETSE
jgi:hypothetical protein